MTDNPNHITIRLDIHNGDVTHYALEPTPKVGIYEVLSCRLVSGMWEVTSTDPEAHKTWRGHRKSRNASILDYLAARLWAGENDDTNKSEEKE